MTNRDERLGVTVAGKYRVVRFLAQGGMGAVYEAVHVVLNRRFALKFLRPELTQRRDALARFKQEATAAGSLESENVAAVVDFGVAPEGTPYMVLEYLDGWDLGRLHGALGLLPTERAVDLVIQACRGMREAHARGIIHRDLKPSNLFVCHRADGTDQLKIMDFGIAKLVASDARTAVTRTGSMVGTPAYMSPEQARGEAAIDHRTDVHALGAILYELLSGRTPHPGESFNAIIHHLATQAAMPLASDGRVYPQGIAEVVERALASDPASRQSSVEELAVALEPFAFHRAWPPIPEAPPSPPRPVPQPSLRAPRDMATASRSNYSVSQVEVPVRPSRTPRAPRWLAAILVAAGGIAALGLLSESAPTAARRSVAPSTERPSPAAPLPPKVLTTSRVDDATLAALFTAPTEEPSGAPPPSPNAPLAPVRRRARPPAEFGHRPGRPRAVVPTATSAPSLPAPPPNQAAFDPHNPFD